MAKFLKKEKGGLPAISTSSLPDIVFIILMFFMICVSMRQSDQKVRVVMPQATEVAKLERKDLSSYIFIGTPTQQYQAQFGTESRIQLNDSFKTVDDIRDFIAAERENLSEVDRPFMTVNIKADQDTRMGIITDVKQELRRCSALKIMYGARKVKN